MGNTPATQPPDHSEIAAVPPISSISITDDVKKYIDAAIDAKVEQYKRLAYAFAAGVMFIVSLPVLDHVLNSNKFIDSVRDQIIQFEPRLARSLGPPRVALSYTNQYWLDSTASQQQFAFYATKAQHVTAYLQILHAWPADRAEVSITLDDRVDNLWHGSEDLPWHAIDLTDELNRKGVISAAGPENVRFLVFRVSYGKKASDRIFVSVVLNVIGFDLSRKDNAAS
jgi:hypothetical protein